MSWCAKAAATRFSGTPRPVERPRFPATRKSTIFSPVKSAETWASLNHKLRLAQQVQEATEESVTLAFVDPGYTGEKAAQQAASHPSLPTCMRQWLSGV